MPWVSLATVFGSTDAKGTDGDGKFTAAIAVIAGLAALLGFNKGGRSAVSGAGFLCLIGVGVSLYEWQHISAGIGNIDTGGLARASVGTGVWITLIGFAVGAVCLFKASPDPLDAYKDPVPFPPPRSS